MAKTEGYLDCYLRSILADTAGFAGLESIRRVVGMANVKDITSITAPVKRERAERIIITLAKEYILKAATFTDGKSYRNAIENTIKKY
jgi:5-methylthioribose kinase